MRASGVLLQSVLTEAGVRHIAEWGLEHFVPSEHIAEWVLKIPPQMSERLIICKEICRSHVHPMHQQRGPWVSHCKPDTTIVRPDHIANKLEMQGPPQLPMPASRPQGPLHVGSQWTARAVPPAASHYLACTPHKGTAAAYVEFHLSAGLLSQPQLHLPLNQRMTLPLAEHSGPSVRPVHSSHS